MRTTRTTSKVREIGGDIDRKGSVDTTGVISFYRANERPYGVLSNLYRREIEFEGRIFPTSEHAYQAGKALKPAVREWIQAAPSPSLAAMAAHGLYTWDVVPDWANIKFDRMRAVLRAKFTQHPDLAEILISTGTKRLVEVGSVNNAVNRLWGEVNGKGKNMLGVMLMELREEISNGLIEQDSWLRRDEVSLDNRSLNEMRADSQ
ncbi:NADAR family protein [Rhizobium lentis]|nr:NADAR family protein [Rhizobium lentis]MBX5018563.1 NADAR family protein [Rhizobium lentis]MBX5065052.1 NADAR family protein [Rhizobium lentis]MBX5077124.1 NADAR family protein [Rhizobium lentis]QSW96832.1 NADAR family protein [Rhizobium lentis]